MKTLKSFSGIFIIDGEVRRMRFEAVDLNEAKAIAVKWGVGVEGEAPVVNDAPAPLPEAYDQETARRLLGNISRTSLYAELAKGNLERVHGTRRVLITRRSLERRCRQ